MAKGIYFQAICGPVKSMVLFKQEERRTFLVVQWIRTHLPRQGIQVRSLVWEDSTCCRAAKPVCHSYWAHLQQLLKPVRLEPELRKRSHCSETPAYHQQRVLPVDTTRESPCKAMKARCNQKKKKNKKKVYNAFLNLLKVFHIDMELTCSLWFQRKIWGPLHMFDIRNEFLIELFKATSIQVTGFSPVIHFNNLPTCSPDLVQSHFTWPSSLLTAVQPHWFSSFTSLNSPQGP